MTHVSLLITELNTTKILLAALPQLCAESAFFMTNLHKSLYNLNHAVIMNKYDCFFTFIYYLIFINTAIFRRKNTGKNANDREIPKFGRNNRDFASKCCKNKNC